MNFSNNDLDSQLDQGNNQSQFLELWDSFSGNASGWNNLSRLARALANRAAQRAGRSFS